MNSEQKHSDSGCFHCGLPLPDKNPFVETIKGQEREFCCYGCQSVCKVIYDAGLEGFYQRTPEGSLLAPPPETPKDLGFYDLDEVQSEFVTKLDVSAEARDIHLLVEGIHCAACVWLIERTLLRMDGVMSCNVNLSGKRLHLRWDNSRIRLSNILRRLADIGYAAVPYDQEAAEGALKDQNRALLFRMAFAGFAMMNLLWISIALYSGADKGEFRSLFQWVGFALATPTLFYSGWPFLKGAMTGLRQGHLGMDLPIAIGASTTYLYSIYVMLGYTRTGEVYYDTVVNFLFVILVGRHLESLSKRHAVAANQRLLDLQPRVATVLRNNQSQVVAIRSVKAGEHVLIKPGDSIPVDGIVVEGESAVNEAMLSGESLPCNKKPGDVVSAGTINTHGALTVKVEGVLKNTALGRIISMVEEAQASKAPIQCIADRIVPWFVAITLLLATATFLWWYKEDFELALMAATSVMIITCPCAFGLATPMAIAVASGLGARNGILVKNGEVLESLSHVTHFVFDKTGTLTEGKMKVHTIIDAGLVSENELLDKAAVLEGHSEHSIAKAITQQAEAKGLVMRKDRLAEFVNRPGYGVSGQVDGHEVIIGTADWLVKNNIAVNETLLMKVESYEQKGMTCSHIAVDGQHAGVFVIADQLRPQAKDLIAQLRQQGLGLTMLSGDRKTVAEAIAAELGGMDTIAEVLPEHKDEVIARLQAQGEKVAMVGDGVNDAPALIRADVGIALGSGTDVSMDSADIVLLHDDLSKVSQASMLSRRTLRAIRQNIGISFSYNIIMVPLAMMTFVTPLVAAISMPISSLLVIANAARIRSVFKAKNINIK
ncbi:MAG: heavy metal translocating P-type ATPase [Gammaproteobacteria bacterium]|nr:heavy metal translocating P-type ATPase [Gammaproteobacteria bacterium]